MTTAQTETNKKKKIGLVSLTIEGEESTHSKKTPLILLNSVRKLGKASEVVKVAGGFARYLIAQKKAVYATVSNMDKLSDYKAELAKKDAAKIKEAEEMKAKLNGLEFTFFCKVRDKENIYGSIQTHDIAEKLSKEGFKIEKSQILLGQSLKVLGAYGISISLYGDVEAHVILHLKSSADGENKS